MGVGDPSRRRGPGQGPAATKKNSSLAPPTSLAWHPLPKGERTDSVCVAQIGAAHGLRGEVRLRSFTEDPSAVAAYGALESEDGARQFEIETLRPAKDVFVARLKGIADRNAAERLTNLKLYARRDRLPAVEDENTFYHADLVGLAVVTPDGTALGTVRAVHNFGAGDIIDITRADGDTLMVPFTDTAVPTIDLDAGRIVVVLPDIVE